MNIGDLTPAERHQIETHKYFMSRRAGYDVGMDAACADWEARYGAEWRCRRQEAMLAMQREEISRYKWIRSEEAKRDLGRDAALEWIRTYAASWRKWYEEEFEAQ